MKKNYQLICSFLGLGLMWHVPCAAHVNLDKYQAVFTSIYDNAFWGRNAEGLGFSGRGSLAHNARPYMDLLQQFMASHNIHSVVDIGCGDWEFSRYIAWDTIQYTGYDVVEHVIRKNIMRYETPNIHFVHANFLEIDLPKADLLICKDVLQHMPNKDIMQFLTQTQKFSYCLIVNEVEQSTLSSNNDDINVGHLHTIDLRRYPFNISGTVLLNYHIDGHAHQVFLIDNTHNATQSQ